MSSFTSSPILISTLASTTIDWVDVLGDFLGDESEPKAKYQKRSEFSSSPRATSNLKPVATQPHKSSPHNVTAPRPAEAVRDSTHSVSVATKDGPKEKPTQPKLSAADKAKLRCEKKRSREKQRRSDVNTQFSELTALLKKIESEDAQDDGSSKSNIGSIPSSMNRVDLIGKTITALDKIYTESCKRKRTIEDLSSDLKVAKKRADEASSKLRELESQPGQNNNTSESVMMMVPMMVSPDGASQSAFMPQPMPYYPMCAPGAPEKSTRGAMPSYSSMFNPFMYGNQFCPQPNKAGDASLPPNQHQYVPTMVPMPSRVDNDSLAYCA